MTVYSVRYRIRYSGHFYADEGSEPIERTDAITKFIEDGYVLDNTVTYVIPPSNILELLDTFIHYGDMTPPGSPEITQKAKNRIFRLPNVKQILQEELPRMSARNTEEDEPER